MHIQLIDRVLAQIERDVDSGDLTAIHELIADIPDEKAVHYLTDESLAEVMEREVIDPEGLAEAMEHEMQYLAATKIDPDSALVRLLRERLGN
jgi:hypothetical protein